MNSNLNSIASRIGAYTPFGKIAGRTLLAAIAGFWLAPQVAQTAIIPNYQFNGKGNWSIDAIGSNSDPVGLVTASVPLGSTIEKAFLYSSMTSGYQNTIPNVQLGSTVYSPASFTPLGINLNLQAYRADVTAQMQAELNGGSALPVNFSVRELSNNTLTDGEALVIIYSNPAEQTRTIGILDGFASSGGDNTVVTFSSPIDTTLPGFEALLSLGIGYSFQSSGQVSNVDVSIGSRRLTSSAGGQDDGIGANGGLITIGGIGDSAANPAPFATDAGGPRTDDELYNLALGNSDNPLPFLPNGTTSFSLRTANPSADDLVFFVGFNVTADGIITPEPSSVVLAAFGMLSLVVVGYRRRTRKG